MTSGGVARHAPPCLDQEVGTSTFDGVRIAAHTMAELPRSHRRAVFSRQSGDT